MKRNLELHPPALPPQLNRGTLGVVLERQRERAAKMESAYPGIQFSLSTSNPLAVKQNLGFPGIGLPRAIYNPNCLEVTDTDVLDLALEKYRELTKKAPYLTYTSLKYATGLPFMIIFGVVRHFQKEGKVHFTVDRTGDNVAFKLNI